MILAPDADVHDPAGREAQGPQREGVHAQVHGELPS